MVTGAPESEWWIRRPSVVMSGARFACTAHASRAVALRRSPAFTTHFIIVLSFLRLLLGLTALSTSAAAQTYEFTTIAGIAGTRGGTDGIGTNATFDAEALTVDRDGNIYVANTGTHTIRRVARDGTVTTISGALGIAGSSDGSASAARFNAPAGIAVDGTGNVYVADSGNYTLRQIAPQGGVTTVAGVAGSGGNVDGPGSAARLSSPRTLVMEPDGNLLLCDFGSVRRITPAGHVTTIAASRFLWRDPGFHANALARDRAGTIYVTSTNGAPVQRYSTGYPAFEPLAGEYSRRGIADGSGETAEFGSNLPGLVVTPSDAVIVADAENHTLRHLTPTGVVTTIAGWPRQRGTLDGLGGNARFDGIRALAIAPDGDIVVLDQGGTTIRRGRPVAAPAPPILLQGPVTGWDSYRAIGARTALTLSTVVAGGEPLRYEWTRDGVPLPGESRSTFTIPSASAADRGTYAVTVSNPSGSFRSPGLTVDVYVPKLSAFVPLHTRPGGSFLWSIASGGGKMVAVGTGGKVLTSTDGTGWTARLSGTNDWLVGVTYGAGKFVAVGDRGTILVSSDGETWTRAVSSGTAERLNNVVYGGGRFVAVGERGTVVSSPDAQTWALGATGVTGWLRALVYKPLIPRSGYAVSELGSGRFYASGEGGTVLTSATGEQWSVAYRPSGPGAGRDIETFAPGPIGIGESGGILEMSYHIRYLKVGAPVEFLLWQHSQTGIGARFRALLSGEGALFATGENGLIVGAPGPQGPWAIIPSGTTANLVHGVMHGNSLYVVGENETILQSERLYASRLINIATRGVVDGGANAMISGFVVTGSTPKQILVRAAGPALRSFGVAEALASPTLTLYNGAGQPMAWNTGWANAAQAPAVAAAAAQVGAFPFAAGSADSALLLTLPPGAYTAHVTSPTGTSGIALLEAYDAEPLAGAGSRAVNISTRGQVGTGAHQLIAGVVIKGASTRRVLIRAVGPSLAQFGISDALAEPQLRVYTEDGWLHSTVGAWSERADADEIAAASRIAGAFALPEGSRDAAFVTTLAPRSYTVQVSGVNNTTGTAIVEVYDLP
jgi:sugar lactone lactonase YvrE